MNTMKQLLLFLFCMFYSYSCFGQVKITMERHGNVYYVPGKVNGLSMKFIFDTGASNVCLSLTEALFMLKNGYIKEADLGEKGYTQIADGNIVENTKVILRNIEIGGVTINDVAAVITNSLDAPLLLGQSAIQKLGPIQLDGNMLVIANGKDIPSEAKAEKLYYKAYQQVEAKEYDKAIENSLEALENTKAPRLRAMLYDNIGNAYSKKGDNNKALDSFSKALEADMSYTPSRYNLGVVNYEMKKYDDALRAFQLYISNVASKDSQSLSAAYCYIGQIFEKEGRYNESGENYLNSIRLNPSRIAYFGLADVCGITHNYEKAAENYRKGLEYAPNNMSSIKYYHKLGMCLVYMNKRNEAYDAFDNCIKTTSRNKELLFAVLDSSAIEENLRAFACECMALSLNAELWSARVAPNAQECIRRYNHIMSYNPPIPKELEMTVMDYYTLAKAYDFCKETENVVRIIDMGLKKFDNDPELLFLKSLHMPSDSEECISIYKKILRKESLYTPQSFDYGTVYNNIAWGYCLQKKYNEALPYSLKAIELNPEHGYSWETLGELYFYLGQYEKCIDAMTKCIACNDDKQYKDAYEMRGKSYLKIGNTKEGKRDINKAKEM